MPILRTARSILRCGKGTALNNWMEKIKRFNAEMNRIPEKLMWILLVIAGLSALLWLLPYVAPFLLAALFSWVLGPAVKLLSKALGNRGFSRKIAAAILVVGLSGLLLFGTFALAGRLIMEVGNLAAALPEWISQGTKWLIGWIEGMELEWSILEDGVEKMLLDALSKASSSLVSMASTLATVVAKGAWRTAVSLPEAIVFVVLTLLGTFYISSDPEKVLGFVRRQIPVRLRGKSSELTRGMLRVVLVQVRAALIMMLVVFVVMTLGFTILGVEYAFLMALIIAVMDALPVLGAGLFLTPGIIYGAVTGEIKLAVGFALLYVVIVVIRQLLEPRIIGRHLGLNPLATMMAMYAGLQAVGFAGMLLGPLTLLLCRLVLDANSQVQQAREGGTETLPEKKEVPLLKRKKSGKAKRS